MRKPIKDKDIMKMTIQEFEQLPCRKWDEDIGEFISLILLPYRNKLKEAINEEELSEAIAQRMKSNEREAHTHDSGFRLMDYVAADRIHPICRLAAGSDVLHIAGIGGKNIGQSIDFGTVKPDGTLTFALVEQPIAWSIDCLPTSGLFRLFAPHNNLMVGTSLSSFEVFAVPEIRNKKNEKSENNSNTNG